MLFLCDYRHWLFTRISLLSWLFVIIKVSFLHMSSVGQAASLMQLSSMSQIFGFKESTILVDLNIFLWTKVRSWFYVMAWAWSPMCSYPLTQYSIWLFSDYNLTNDAAETRSEIMECQLSHLWVAVEKYMDGSKANFFDSELSVVVNSWHILPHWVLVDCPQHNWGVQWWLYGHLKFNGLEDPWVDEVFHCALECLNDNNLYCAGLYWQKQLFEYSRAFW